MLKIFQVVNTIQAEMIADIRNYDPGDPANSVTAAWDQTQARLGCCGLVTEQVQILSTISTISTISKYLHCYSSTYPQVTAGWEMWRYNKILNPSADFQVRRADCGGMSREYRIESTQQLIKCH